MSLDTITYPWRVEVRATHFSPWVVHGFYPTLDAACDAWRLFGRHARVRAN